MRASGRGGRQGPRGGSSPPRALLRPGASMRAAPFRAPGAPSLARGLVLCSGAPSLARGSLLRSGGIMNGYESAFALTSP